MRGQDCCRSVVEHRVLLRGAVGWRAAVVVVGGMDALEALPGREGGPPMRARWGAALGAALGAGAAWTRVATLEAVAPWAVELGGAKGLGSKLSAKGDSLKVAAWVCEAWWGG